MFLKIIADIFMLWYFATDKILQHNSNATWEGVIIDQLICVRVSKLSWYLVFSLFPMWKEILKNPKVVDFIFKKSKFYSSFF